MLYTFLIIFIINAAIYRCEISYDFDVKGNAFHGYYISSLIGTPPQHINLLIDTGSSNLAVTVVNNKGLNTRHFAYNESLTFRPTGVNIQLQYVQGYWTGFVGLDVFNPCLTEDCTIICNISCMLTMEDIFDDNSLYHGIIGLAYSSIAFPTSSVRPFLDVFFEEKQLPNIFALFLCGPFYSSEEQSSSCGKIHVGHIYQNLVLGNIMYTPIIHEWFYEVTVVDIKVDETSVPFDCQEFNKNRSFIDSGTTNLNLPASVYSWVIGKIKDHAKSFISSTSFFNETVICAENKSVDISVFPSLTLSLYHSHNTFFHLHISPELYMLPLNATCAMFAIGLSDYGVMIGSSILKGFYIIFDRENKRVGFAKPKLSQNIITSISDVSNLNTHDSFNFDHCVWDVNSADSTLSTGLGLILICLLFITLCVLVPLLTWLWKFHIKKVHADRSDILNLVDDDD